MAENFDGILSGSESSFKILENEEFLAFLSPKPLREGHTLVIPRRASEALFEMEADVYSRLMLFAKKTARFLKEVIPCTKIGLMAAGIQVRHVHLHLVPIDQPSDLDFSKAAAVSAQSLRATQAKLTAEIHRVDCETKAF